MKDKPTFSVITVCFNGGSDLEKTINSVKDQSCNDLEYIVIDGGSKDNTLEILKKYSEDINYWVSEPDKGIYNAMNKGAKAAHGEYLYFLNSGDVFSDIEVLNKVKKDLADKDLVYGQIRVVNKNDDDSYLKDKVLSKSKLRRGVKVSQQAVFLRKSVFDEVGGLDEQYRIASDFDLLCKVFDSDYSISHIDTVICNYDRDGISSNLKKSYGDTSRVIKNRYGLIYFIVYMIITRVKLLVANFI